MPKYKVWYGTSGYKDEEIIQAGSLVDAEIYAEELANEILEYGAEEVEEEQEE